MRKYLGYQKMCGNSLGRILKLVVLVVGILLLFASQLDAAGKDYYKILGVKKNAKDKY
jgi:Sec-independent protein translocase protein TatA